LTVEQKTCLRCGGDPTVPKKEYRKREDMWEELLREFHPSFTLVRRSIIYMIMDEYGIPKDNRGRYVQRLIPMVEFSGLTVERIGNKGWVVR